MTSTLPAVRWTHVTDHHIGGVWIPARRPGALLVTDPATEEVWGSAPDATDDEVDAAVGAADRALRTGPWVQATPAQRARVLLAAADWLEEHAAELAHTITRENGSPVAETAGAAANAASIFRHAADLAEHLAAEDVRPFPGTPGQETLVRKDPIGVCALIAPWNFPINLMAVKLAPALLAGCSVVLKPAPSTPLSVRFLVSALQHAQVPEGVVNLVTGGNSVGDRLVRHPLVAKVAFTGSTPVGRAIAAACGELLRPVTLELGGKSAAVVLPDADLDQLAAVLLRTCLRNTGQTCYISTRLLVPDERHDEVVDVVTRVVSEAPQGDPSDPATVFGPLATRAQYDKVLGLIEGARDEGARVTTGGGPAHRGVGWFVQPTVLVDVTPDMAIAREEVFGPVLVIQRYSSIDDAIALANDTPFGLGGTVFSADPERALAVAEAMDTGSVGLGFFASNHAAPFGGRHDSGLGVEYGVEGLTAYLTHKSIHRRARGREHTRPPG